MKILQINKLYFPWIGGVEKAVQDIAEGLREQEGITMTVLACQPKGKSTAELVHGVTVYRAGSWGMALGMPLSLSFFRLFRRLSRSADVLIVHYPFPLGMVGARLFARTVPFFVYYHSDIVRQKALARLFAPFDRWVLRNARGILVSNPAIIQSSPLLQLFKEKCTVVPFGIDEREFVQDAAREKRITEIQNRYGKNFVLFVGRLIYYKGVEYLVEAAERLRNEPENFVLIGAGALQAQLQQRIAELHLEQKITLLPLQDRQTVIDYCFACGLLVLPSIYRSEAFGIVLMEAMAAGKPVISTDLGTGTSYINQHHITGFVVPPRDSAALAGALHEILRNPHLQKSFGIAARERVHNFFSRAAMVVHLMQIIQEKG